MYIIMAITGTQKKRLMMKDFLHLEKGDRLSASSAMEAKATSRHKTLAKTPKNANLLAYLLAVVQVAGRAVFFHKRSLKA